MFIEGIYYVLVVIFSDPSKCSAWSEHLKNNNIPVVSYYNVVSTNSRTIKCFTIIDRHNSNKKAPKKHDRPLAGQQI